MASTTLFAPQVRAVQPAFVYEGAKNAKIYFDFSKHNSINDVGGILFTLIDPNLTSAYGTNSIIKTSFANTGFLCYTFSIVEKDSNEVIPIPNEVYCILEKEKYIIQSSLTSFKDNVVYYKINNLKKDDIGYYFSVNFSRDIFNPLTVNSFYVMQLYAVDRKVGLSNQQNITELWLETNKNNISIPSQATLLRPILNPSVYIEGVQIEKNIWQTYDFISLKGWISYEGENEIEGLDSYYCVFSQETDIIKGTSINKNIKSKVFRGSGLKFEIDFKEKFLTGKIYKGTLYLNTVHGYKITQNIEIQILAPQELDASVAPKVSSVIGNLIGGFISGTCVNTNDGDILERSSIIDNYAYWDKLGTIYKNSFQDLLLDNRVQYKYRISRFVDGIKYIGPVSNAVGVELEDIYLSDSSSLLVIKYNPKISNFKYITQENILNTLGGRYPIITRNGNTYYKQFNLSGTLFFEDLVSDSGDSDSVQSMAAYDSISYWFSNSLNLSLYLTKNNDYNLSYLDSQSALETKARKIAIDFLTNGKIKMFRSGEEENMIVYLSNVSFTPNEKLGRHIVDFSATVTEVCECTLDNVKKYKTQPENEDKYIAFTSQIKQRVDNDELANMGQIYGGDYKIN